MQLSVTGRHLTLTDALEDHARDKFKRLERHFDHLTNVHVILSVERGGQHRAEATVHGLGRELFADATANDPQVAIDALVRKLDRQVTRHKEKVTDHHRGSGGLKSDPPPGPGS